MSLSAPTTFSPGASLTNRISICLHLTKPNQDGVLFGYFRPSDPHFSDLKKRIDSAEKFPIALTLSLAFPAGTLPRSSSNQVEIKSMEAPNWIR